MCPSRGPFLGSHRVETCIETSTAGSSTCAGGVVRTQLGHSGLTYKTGSNRFVKGPYHSTPNSNGIPTADQTIFMKWWSQTLCSSHMNCRSNLFFHSGTGSSENCASACSTRESVRSAMIYDSFFGRKMKFGGLQGSISCFLRTNCPN